MYISTLTRWVRLASVPAALAILTGAHGGPLLAQAETAGASRTVRALAETGPSAADWGRRIENLQRAGSLRLRSSREDTMVDGRVHDRLDQYVGDVRIFGAQIVRQRSAAGVESVFGQLHPDPGIPLEPALARDAAVARVVEIAGRGPIGGQAPELVVLPEDGGYRLVWFVHARFADVVVALFLDAQDGREVRRYSAMQRQSAVGTGSGVLGERRKLSTRSISGGFLADDELRPPVFQTLDLQGDHLRAWQMLDGDVSPAQSDTAFDADNAWTDGVVVDAHAGLGFTYDYFFARFNRRGFDDRDRPIRAMVHAARRDDPLALPSEVISSFLLNAFWCDVCGTGNAGFLVFGEGLPASFTSGGQRVNYFAAAFDIIAHEYTHAVTSYTSDLVYQNESGALNESFSDIMAVGAEFYLVSSGRSTREADYILGEDAFTPAAPFALAGNRSLPDPLSYGYPDHYAIRYRGPFDNGGVHINSSISNHAFYLAIEGGRNRTSGLEVQGVGAANREQIERVFYRGFTSYLTPASTFAQARQATLRAASDLYGESSAAFRAVQQAWTAVGVH